jgi:hypothetical protein
MPLPQFGIAGKRPLLPALGLERPESQRRVDPLGDLRGLDGESPLVDYAVDTAQRDVTPAE